MFYLLNGYVSMAQFLSKKLEKPKTFGKVF